MKRGICRFVALMAMAFALNVWADTWYDETTGYTWSYSTSQGEATIRNGYAAAVSPSPSGELEIPSSPGGYRVMRIGRGASYDGLMSVTILDAVDALGSIASIQAGFMELLKKVYAA